MLKFIFGPPASGKTQEILKRIKALAESGEESVLIVPEQFSFESERAVLKALGEGGILNVTVTSFSRLYDEVCRLTGGVANRALSDSDKIIFINKALSTLEGELKLWSKYCRSVTFAKTMLDTVGEFKINGITAADIKKTVLLADKPSLKNKLSDIALIYETYDAFTGEQFIDPADSLTVLYNKLANFKYFENKTVFLDSFKGFTGQQFSVLDRIFAQAKDVYVGLTNNVELDNEYNVFCNIRRIIKRIERLAKAHAVKVAEPLILNKSYYNSQSLAAVEGLISGKENVNTVNDGALTICSAATVFDEADFVARTIRRLVRTQNYRYRDFVIIARDSERYEEAVAAACRKNEVALFYDKRLPLSAFPLASAVDCAIKALNFSTENILRFHKTGLGTLNFEEVTALENYTYLWNLNGKIWLNEWDMDVRGLVASNDTDYNADGELEKINELRKRAIEPIVKFKAAFSGNAHDLAAAIVGLIAECDCGEKLAEMSRRFLGDTFSSDVLRQSYDAYNNILDSLVRCFGKKEIKTSAFCDALETAVSLETIGVIPQMLDEVTFGAADRIRPSRPKIAFILGANQGIFPKNALNTGIFAVNERKALIELGLEIEDNSIFSAIDEEFLVYSNLCCPSDALYICYSRQTLSGEALEPSAFVSTLTEKLGCREICEPDFTLKDKNLPETAYSAYLEYCRSLKTHPENCVTLQNALSQSEYAAKIEYINSCEKRHDKSLSRQSASALYGKDIYMSATRFDTYNRCHFSFFCRYGLGAKRLQPADFDVLQRGTIVHYVLERLIATYKKQIADLAPEKLDELTDLYINEYLDSIVGYRSIETARTRFLVSKISRSLKEVVRHVSVEFKQSDFEPVACELKIGSEGGIPFRLSYDEGDILLSGSIDRVDKYNGYIRIIDYKTGTKAFKLPDILFGLNLQMLIYLYAVIRGQGADDNMAAGIFYMPSKRDINENGMVMNGLLQADPQLVNAMDKSGCGEFVPKLSFNKDGSLSKRQTSFITAEEFGEIFDYIEKLMRKTGNSIASGDISVSPVDGRESPACKYCDFKAVCGIEDGAVYKVPDMRNDEVFQKMREGE